MKRVRLFLQLFGGFCWLALSSAQALADPLADAQKAYAAGNYAKAMNLYTPLAQKGNPLAQLSLGTMYYIGQGTTQSYKDAAKWFERSAKQGNVLAQNIMGEMHDQGLGVAQDYSKAALWYKRAAEQGDAHGQYNLGLMHARGLGVTLDLELAYMWLSLSGKPSDELNRITQLMTANQISMAQERAAQCPAKQFKRC